MDQRPSDKVTAATTMAGVSSAMVTIAMWLLKTYAHVDVPDAVNVAVVLLVTVVLTGFVGYFTFEGHPADSAIRTVYKENLVPDDEVSRSDL